MDDSLWNDAFTERRQRPVRQVGGEQRIVLGDGSAEQRGPLGGNLHLEARENASIGCEQPVIARLNVAQGVGKQECIPVLESEARQQSAPLAACLGRRAHAALSHLLTRALGIEEAFVDIQVRVRHDRSSEGALECGANTMAIQLGDACDGFEGLGLRIYNESADTRLNNFGNRAAVPGDDWSSAGHGFDHHQPEGLGPVDGKDQGSGIAEEL